MLRRVNDLLAEKRARGGQPSGLGSLTSLKPTQIAGRAREKMAHSMGLLFITESIAKVLAAKKDITSED